VSVLREAATWLRERGIPLWLDSELDPEDIDEHVAAGLYYLGEYDGEPAATLRFQLTDPEFWPEVGEEDSAFVHRFAVRRAYAGGEISRAMLSWAVHRTRDLGRTYLRLDCDSARPRLREFYEKFGFRYHSDRQAGPFLVSRYELRVDQLYGGADERSAGPVRPE